MLQKILNEVVWMEEIPYRMLIPDPAIFSIFFISKIWCVYTGRDRDVAGDRDWDQYN